MKVVERLENIKDYEGLYSVSDFGNVRSEERFVNHGRWGTRRTKQRILKPRKDKGGYLQVNLHRNGVGRTFKIHRLVLGTFAGPCPNGMQACHYNNDKEDNRLENLRWDTPKGNNKDKERHGTTARGEGSPSSKLTEENAIEIIEMWETGNFTQKELGKKYKVAPQNISSIVTGRSWRHLNRDK